VALFTMDICNFSRYYDIHSRGRHAFLDDQIVRRKGKERHRLVRQSHHERARHAICHLEERVQIDSAKGNRVGEFLTKLMTQVRKHPYLRFWDHTLARTAVILHISIDSPRELIRDSILAEVAAQQPELPR